mgnify:CR=1 FL=1
MKAAQMTREDEIRSISQKYEMDKEKVRDILERGVRYADADKAALFAFFHFLSRWIYVYS